MERQNISSGGIWEGQIGYSRAVRVGNVLEISGTVASDEDGKVIGPGNSYEQTRYILKKIEKVLAEAGATFGDVVRTRLFVKDISKWQEVGKAHGEVFADIRPATTMLEISRLIGDEYLIEIEVTAVIGSAA